MSVMSLRAKPGTQVHVMVAGPDEVVALGALSAILSAPERC
jgi:phosphotransferase system HPr-like phosphotransfer protein